MAIIIIASSVVLAIMLTANGLNNKDCQTGHAAASELNVLDSWNPYVYWSSSPLTQIERYLTEFKKDRAGFMTNLDEFSMLVATKKDKYIKAACVRVTAKKTDYTRTTDEVVQAYKEDEQDSVLNKHFNDEELNRSVRYLSIGQHRINIFPNHQEVVMRLSFWGDKRHYDIEAATT
ncbi:MAG: hypothetical protein ACSLEY_00295 [Candidatus Saccharimonadales bacterium]